MRKAPMDESGAELIPPAIKPQLNQRLIGGRQVPVVTQVRSYELITPLFGGGVDPGVSDPVTVVRGPEIRGHLRFWWRACRGGQFNGDLGEMKRREDELWGAASTEKKPRPSKVEIVVAMDQVGEDRRPFEVVASPPDKRSGRQRPKLKANGSVAPAYAAFPLQPSEAEIRAGGVGMETKTVRSHVRFTLEITFPEEDQKDVAAALWAWETFGGTGARTRRGFGALKLLSVNGTPVALPAANEVESRIRASLREHIVDGTWPSGVPYLSLEPCFKVTNAYSDPKAAWEYLIQRLKGFRQSRYLGTSPKQPGRSRWPEPDEIRRLTGRQCPTHASPRSTIGKFPRAAFGLPVVFHFKDQRLGDPDDTTLRGRDHERLASPLILRPLACANSYVGLALILEGTGVAVLPGGLILKGAPGDPAVKAVLKRAEAQKIAPLHGNPDVLQAFLNTL